MKNRSNRVSKTVAFTQILSILLGVLVVFLMSGAAFAATDVSMDARKGGKVETRAPNPEDVAAINKMADYLDKMGRKDVGDKLRADFKSGTVYIGKLGANAEINAGVFGLGRSLALSDASIGQMGSEAGEASWALTVIHEYVHMKQWMPMEDSWHETPAWGSTLRENGLWIRKTLDEINRVGSDASLTPQERVESLKKLSQTLTSLQGTLKVTLNEIRKKMAEGDLDKNNEWQGVPPSGFGEAKGTRDIDAIGKNADAEVEAGEQVIGQYIAQPSVKIEPRPATAKKGDTIQLDVKLYNMPEGSQTRYGWTVSNNGKEISRSTEKSLSCVIDKPGQWTMRMLVKARDKENRMIKGKGGNDWLEDTVTIMAQPYVEIDPRPGSAKKGDTIRLEAKLNNLPEGHLAPHYSWTISLDGVGIAWPKGEILSYAVDKPGKWTMRMLVQVKTEDNRWIKGKEGDNWLEDTISFNVEKAAASGQQQPGPCECYCCHSKNLKAYSGAGFSDYQCGDCGYIGSCMMPYMGSGDPCPRKG
ncbi:MAG: hypothetical protein WCJ71_06340 [Candidatus Omnitrophota bacterium]